MNEVQMRAALLRIIEQNNQFTTWTVSTPHIMMLLNEAVEAEREACAKVADRHSTCKNDTPDVIAAAIRARGQQ